MLSPDCLLVGLREDRAEAIALIANTSSGGKNSAPASAIAFFESFHAFLEEALAPLADNLATGVQPFGDLVVAKTLGREEDEAGSEDIAIRQRMFPSPGLQDPALFQTQIDLVGAGSWHVHTIPEARSRRALNLRDRNWRGGHY